MTEKVMDVLFVIDATGSMSATLKAAHDKATEMAIDLRVAHSDVKFRFGAVCYRDPIDSPNDIHEFMDFDSDIDNLVSFLSRIKADGGGDSPEDWVGALDIALTKLSWQDGAKSIIWIADADAHGNLFCGYENHQDQEPLIEPLIKEISSMKVLFTGLSLNNGANKTFEQLKTIYQANSGVKFTYESFDVYGQYGDFGGFVPSPPGCAIASPMMCKMAAPMMCCCAAPPMHDVDSIEYESCECSFAAPMAAPMPCPKQDTSSSSEEIGNRFKKATMSVCDDAISHFYG